MVIGVHEIEFFYYIENVSRISYLINQQYETLYKSFVNYHNLMPLMEKVTSYVDTLLP